ncbi:hypothetical protein ACFFQW_22035 [Umezawaea endophytica]|uniref:Uncharacterized protein n=1 Tax=Umezawaea endophytica TaxID=1654476 RepID=A0A9X2VJV7_9PSEU|nr:hypothetical protein [Umezawaea endophytica]MCS7477427.1 hypothetical protein [Umezawaea endophytica]
MRWLTLYARSRQIPVALASALVTTFAVWAITDPPNPAMAALSVVSAVGVLAIGLTGQDPHLDRTAAIRWFPRRVAHVVLIAAVASALLLAFTTDLAPAAFVLRAGAGLAGLAALAAAAFGGQHAWTLPLGWFAISFFIPRSDEVPVHVATWLFQAPDNTPAAWTAGVLGVVGTTTYALARPRR